MGWSGGGSGGYSGPTGVTFEDAPASGTVEHNTSTMALWVTAFAWAYLTAANDGAQMLLEASKDQATWVTLDNPSVGMAGSSAYNVTLTAVGVVPPGWYYQLQYSHTGASTLSGPWLSLCQ